MRTNCGFQILVYVIMLYNFEKKIYLQESFKDGADLCLEKDFEMNLRCLGY